MKHLLTTCLLSCLLSMCLPAQNGAIDTIPLSNHYQNHLEKGTQARRDSNYAEAIQYFFLAILAPNIGIVKTDRVLAAVDSTFSLWSAEKDRLIRAEQKQRQIADREAIIATNLSRKLYGYAVANNAREDLRFGDTTQAMIKAHHALDLMVRTRADKHSNNRGIPPAVELAFGDAVVAYFGRQLGQCKGGLIDLQLHSNGELLWASGQDSTLWVWPHPTTDTTVYKFKWNDYVQEVAFNAAQQLVIAGRKGALLHTLGPPTNEIIDLSVETLFCEDPVKAVLWTNSQTFLTGTEHGILQWSASTLAADTLHPTDHPIIDLVAAPNADLILARTRRGLHYGQSDNPKSWATPQLPKDQFLLTSAWLGHSSNWVATTSTADLLVGSQQATDSIPSPGGPFLSVSSTANKQLIAIAKNGGIIALDEKNTPTELLQRPPRSWASYKIASNTTSDHLAVAWQDTLLVMQIPANSPTADTIVLRNGLFNTIAFSPTDPSLLLLGTSNGTLLLRNITTDQWLINSQLAVGIDKVFFDPSGQHLFVGLSQGQVVTIPRPYLSCCPTAFPESRKVLSEMEQQLIEELEIPPDSELLQF